LATLEKGIKDIKNQIDHFLGEDCLNKQLSIQLDSAQKLAEDGWIMSRINTMFQENNYTAKETKAYYDKNLQDVDILELGALEFSFPDKEGPIYAHEFVHSVVKVITIHSIHLEIYHYLKQKKGE
jgi:hypothetical protein